MQILYEDNHLIAVNKPHGQLTQADVGGEVSLFDEVKAFIKERDQKPGNVFLGLLHRLDRPVGGVVLFAKTSKGASRLSEQFRNHTVEKTYWAIVEDKNKKLKIKDSGSVIQWLKKDEVNNIVTAFDREVSGSQRAELTYRVIRNFNLVNFNTLLSFLEVTPKTGRPHQIRVAMASLGTPIVGDLKYGATAKLKHDIALFGRSLSFDHPTTRERITVTAEPTLAIFS